ncbi:MAG: hypothetical protein ACI4JJ_01085 [Huintestinicola sp.]
MDSNNFSPEKRSILYDGKVYEDLLFCFAAVYACGMFCNDRYLSDSVMNIVKPLTSVLMLLCLMIMSFINGCRHRKSFAIWSVCFWLIPLGVITLSAAEPFKFEVAAMTASAFARLLVLYPFGWLSEVTRLPNRLFPVIISVLTLAMFISGYIYTARLIRSIGSEAEEE